jgi:hypothetical protein
MSPVEMLLGTSWGVSLGITLIFCGGCAFMTGQALAATWRPAWQIAPYALLLGCGDRFLIWGLFEGELLSVSGYLIDAVILAAIAVFAYRVTRARQMVVQYPWLYRRIGLFTWGERD